MSDWSMFFAAQLGASASLAGLLFVGISINMSKIISIPILPNRAMQSLVLLGGILMASSLQLVPGQSSTALGLEMLVVGAPLLGFVARLSMKNMRQVEKQYRSSMAFESASSLLATGLYVVTGVVSLAYGTVGTYFIVPAVLLSFVIVLLDAWVLLVEINR